MKHNLRWGSDLPARVWARAISLLVVSSSAAGAQNFPASDPTYMWPKVGTAEALSNAPPLWPGQYKLEIPMAAARDNVIHGEAVLAMQNFDAAAAIFNTGWAVANDQFRTATSVALTHRLNEDFPWVGTDAVAGIADRCGWSDAVFNAASPGQGITQAACYYVANLLIPVGRSEVQLQLNDFAGALRTLFTVYYTTDLSAVSTSTALEGAYGAAIPAGMVFNAANGNKFGPIRLGNGNTLNAALHPLDQAALSLRVARIYVEWGDLLYRQTKVTDAKPKYMQVLSMYRGIWSQVVGGSSTSAVDSEVLRLVLHAHQELLMAGAGLNFLGYPDDYVPVWDYQFLRNAAGYFIREAKSLERDALTFLTSAENATEQQSLAQQQTSVASSGLALQKAKVAQEQTSLTIAQQSQELARFRVDNKKEQIAEFARDHPIATADGLTLGGVVGTTFDALGSTLSELVGYVGSIFGWSKSGAEQKKEKEEMYHDMQREQAELEKALTIASSEVTRATQSLTVAQIGQQIAELELTHATAALQFAFGRVVNAEFWYRLSRRVRQNAHRYLDFGITLAWLTEQAYEYEENERLNQIRFDYLAREDWLAADQLLSDLDAIEYRRIASKQHRQIHVSHIISLQNRDPVDVERLRTSGELSFNTTESEFDLAYPGTFNRRIEAVEVSVVALVGPNGVRGQLTKGPISWLKFAADARAPYEPNTFPDWITLTPANFRLRLIKGLPETMVLSRKDQAQAGLERKSPSDEGLTSVFADQPVAGAWSLTLPKASNDFDYSTIADVLINVHFSAYFDQELKKAVEIERRKLAALGGFPLGNVRAFSFRLDEPDQCYAFFNPTGDPATYGQYRILPLEIRRTAFPPNQTAHKLTQLWLAAVGETGLIPVTFKITSEGLNGGKKLQFDRGQLLVDDAPTGLNSIRWYPDASRGEGFQNVKGALLADAIAGAGGVLLDNWLVRIDASDNPSLVSASTGTLDPQRLAQFRDIVVQFVYSYEVPGVEGAPITMWAHFEQSSNPPTYYRVGSSPTSASWSGSGWVVNSALGVLQYDPTGTPRELTTATTDQLLGDEFDVSLDATVDPGGTFEFRLEGTGVSYGVRVHRATDGTFDFRVDRTSGSSTQVVTQGPLTPVESVLRLRVMAYGDGSSRKVQWFVGPRALGEHLIGAAPHNLERLRLRGEAARIRVDNILIADITGRHVTP